MGRGQLKYRKRGGGGRVGGRAGSPPGGRGENFGRSVDSNPSSASSVPPRRRQKGGGGHIANLPSNTEKWGRSFDSGTTATTGRSRVGFEETARLLDDSDWVAGPRFGGQEDDGYLTALERSHAGGDGGSGFDSVEGLVAPGEGANLLSLNLDVLSACLLRIPPDQRLGLPPGCCDTLDWVDAALEPGSGSVSDAEDIWRRKGGDARQKNTDPVVHAVEQATTRETNKNKIDPNEGLNGQGGNALGAEDGTTQRGVTNIAKEELTTSLDLHANNNKGVSDAVHGAENGDDDVLDALLDLTVAESANTPLSAKTPLPSTINSAPASIAGIAQGMQLGSKVGVTRNISISTNNSTHGGSEKEQESEHALSGTRAHAKKTPALQQPVQQEETAALGSGSGDVGGGGSRVAGGSDADELEDWLDDMLADD